MQSSKDPTYTINRKLNIFITIDDLINCKDMSRNIKETDSPNHFIVLDAIERGIRTLDKISKATRLDKSEVEMVVNDLEVQRLVSRTEKRKLFRTNTEFSTSETGLKLLNSKKRELEEKAKELRQAYNNGNAAKLQTFMNTNRAWVPFMLFSGLMDVLFFASMMSFMGMTMNPQEIAISENSGAASDSGAGTGTESQEQVSAGEAGSESWGGGFDSSVDSGMDFGGDFNFKVLS
ncbi:MAG: MarR family transcriptional regulator [Nitrososphaeraceae archaeon]|nr:MarR family transcriptional regulator [Nitrososphaeraceae archaeon]